MVCNICLSTMHTTVFDDLDLCVLCKAKLLDARRDDENLESGLETW